MLCLSARAQDGSVPPGEDCWQSSDCHSRASFCLFPIPPSFFEPGSDPFDGEVTLRGAGVGRADTVVARRQPMFLPSVGDTAMIPIEILQLSLVSCDPIRVVVNGMDTFWDVAVGLSPMPTPPGSMTMTKAHLNGGTFTSELFVQPVFTFTSVEDPTQVRILDTGAEGAPPDVLRSFGPAPWVHQVDPAIGIPPCGVNFVPGVQQSLRGPDAGQQCCVVVCHAGATATHCVVQSVDCSGCPSGACCFAGASRGRCHVVRASRTETAQQVCEGRGGTYAGDGTDCADTDGDGLDDVKETNHCCGAPDPCSLGTSPTNPDTDGDGFDDGTEVKQGSDPCDAASVP
jgi:hypothetical protein